MITPPGAPFIASTYLWRGVALHTHNPVSVSVSVGPRFPRPRPSPLLTRGSTRPQLLLVITSVFGGRGNADTSPLPINQAGIWRCNTWRRARRADLGAHRCHKRGRPTCSQLSLHSMTCHGVLRTFFFPILVRHFAACPSYVPWQNFFFFVYMLDALRRRRRLARVWFNHQKLSLHAVGQRWL